MAELTQKVKQLVCKHFDGAELPELESAAPGGRIGGVLIWKGFDGHDQVERQEMLWDLLRQNLERDDLQMISLIMTLTPQEREAIAAD